MTGAAMAAVLAAALAPGAQQTPFEVLAVSADLRILTVGYLTGPCWRDRGLGLDEGPRTIRLTVVQTAVEGCAAPATYDRLNLRLRRRVAGRRITGSPRISGSVEELRRSTAPRVIDLAADDAERALAVQGLRARRVGRPDGLVAFQSPFPSRRAEDRVVRLTVGRHLFRARVLDRCLERAGIPTRTRAPEAGDADAPDLVLWLRHARAMASVGLYADPMRARELAPRIRRNVARIDGVFERSRHAAFAWYDPPAEALRRRTHRCVVGPLGRPQS